VNVEIKLPLWRMDVSDIAQMKFLLHDTELEPVAKELEQRYITEAIA